MSAQFMVELNLSGLLVQARFGELLEAAERAEQMRESKGNRLANQVLLDVVGLTLTPTLSDAYYREALDYHLGQVHAHLGQAEKAAACFERSGTLPHSGGKPVFSEQAAQSLALREQQLRAASRGLPPILLATMPRSASATLTQSISATLDVPIMRISAGGFPDNCIVPRWLDCFMAGGAVLHDHLCASPFNLNVLREAGIREVFVQARDPRAAAHSVTQMAAGRVNDESSRPLLASFFMQATLFAYIPWLAQWIDAAADPSLPFAVHWLRSDHARADLDAAVHRILTVLAPRYPAAAEHMQRAVTHRPANFAVGDDNAWRGLVDEQQQAQLWSAIPQGARTLLELAP